MSAPLELFYSYADADETLRTELEKHLSQLRREGLIAPWHKRQITAGIAWEKAVDEHLSTASVILLLISADFLASDYCYGTEMQRALERQRLDLANVIPILLRPVDWKKAPFAYLQCLPTNEKPVTSWANQDEAFADIVAAIRARIAQLSISSLSDAPPLVAEQTQQARSRYTKTFQGEPSMLLADFNQKNASASPGSLQHHEVQNDLAEKSFFLTQRRIDEAALGVSNIHHSKSSPRQYTLMKFLKEHAGWVRCVTFDPVGHLLASGSDDGSIKLWNLSADTSVHTLKNFTNTIPTLAFSPDSLLLASGGDNGSIKLWNLSARNIIQTIQAHSAWISCVAFSPDGHLLASGSEDGTIRLWEIPSGRIVSMLRGGSDWICNVAFSPDGHLIAAGSLSKMIKIWEIATERNVRTLKGRANIISSVAFSPDGYLLAGGGDDGSIELWEASSGRAIGMITEHAGWVRCVLFSPDGQLLVSGSEDQTIKVWNVSTNQVVQTLIGHTGGVTSLFFNFNGSIIASGGKDKNIIIWTKE